MIIRKIKPEELKRSYEVFALAFEFPMEDEKPLQEVADEAIRSPKKREEHYSLERMAAFDDDDKTMMGFIITTPYDIHFDHHICKMSGIGGVSTLPQYRRGGLIRKCFTKSFEEMYENGFAFSYLYPFSTAYYRQFGYETGCEKFSYHINLRSIKRFDVGGSCCLVEDGNAELEAIKSVHRGFVKDYNMTVEREDYDFLYATEADPVMKRRYTYVYRDENAIPKGVISFTKESEGDHFDMRCHELIFSDMQGFKGLLNFAMGFATYYENMVFTLPTDINITPYIPETALYPYRCERGFVGMVRVINVKKVLEMAHYNGSGSLTLQICDRQISQNSNTFSVSFEDGSPTEVCITDKSPDVSMGINDFSRLIVGICDTSAIKYMETVTVHTEYEKLGQVFFRKPNTVVDFF